jgi:D-arabinose 5-phosphate isomerase GutQ
LPLLYIFNDLFSLHRLTQIIRKQMITLILGTMLALSALAGASAIVFVVYKMITECHHDYWCHTDRINPELSHGNTEPHYIN